MSSRRFGAHMYSRPARLWTLNHDTRLMLAVTRVLQAVASLNNRDEGTPRFSVDDVDRRQYELDTPNRYVQPQSHQLDCTEVCGTGR